MPFNALLSESLEHKASSNGFCTIVLLLRERGSLLWKVKGFIPPTISAIIIHDLHATHVPHPSQ